MIPEINGLIQKALYNQDQKRSHECFKIHQVSTLAFLTPKGLWHEQKVHSFNLVILFSTST